ncbi:MAG: hypothetical protein ACTSRI_18420, partial [Promethearchaeota archaeon]
MVSIIHGLSGITLFSRVFESFCEDISEELSSELIGSFLTAIKLFSREFGQDKIKQIEMSTIKFLIYEKERVMIFFLLDSSDIILEYEMSLKFCLNIFLEMFSKQIYSNYQNVDIFQNYNPVLHEILKVPPDKIEPSCLN